MGFLAAIIYIFITPKQYEGTLQIQMGKVMTIYNLNPVNVEEPNNFIMRMSSSGSYDQEQMEVCGAFDSLEFQKMLGGKIKWSIAKGILNAVELRVRDKDPVKVNKCLTSLFELVKATQAKEAATFSKAAENRLSESLVNLEEKQKIINQIDKAGSGITSTYILTLEQMRTYMDINRIDRNIMSFNKDSPPKLIAPINVGDEPVIPKKKIALLIGAFGGLLVGLLLALFRAGSLTSKTPKN
jgi:uncharacterized protein involved in exopolysaccharide biosynthesis